MLETKPNFDCLWRLACWLLHQHARSAIAAFTVVTRSAADNACRDPAFASMDTVNGV
ncbi:hypothetical protein [Desulfosporosinus sp.]|uniref:hypothetical protein n=1 Tax=Desulfosporosinus sp. TaxID=157907 RepID=UPI00263713A8|nr:hypothetical protein [Desulfosporosinus sp.]